MNLLNLFIVIIIAGLVFYVAFWGLKQIALPEPFGKIAMGILIVAVVVWLIGVLTGSWRVPVWVG